MKRQTLILNIRTKQSCLCVGLDTDIEKIPPFLLNEPDPIFTFNKAIIDATIDHCVSYKINTAFYEAQGVKGWEAMQKTLEYIPKNFFTIADAKRGDIGNTGEQYAKAFFQQLPFDSITVAPYMGEDSVKPFLNHPDKWAIILALTSNAGAADFQMLQTTNQLLYQEVLHKTMQWGTPSNTMYVVGATKANMLQSIREIMPDHFLLIPGVGTQGGTVADVCTHGLNKDVGLLINVSRQIIYASHGKDFATAAKSQANELHSQMKEYIHL